MLHDKALRSQLANTSAGGIYSQVVKCVSLPHQLSVLWFSLFYFYKPFPDVIVFVYRLTIIPYHSIIQFILISVIVQDFITFSTIPFVYSVPTFPFWFRF